MGVNLGPDLTLARGIPIPSLGNLLVQTQRVGDINPTFPLSEAYHITIYTYNVVWIVCVCVCVCIYIYIYSYVEWIVYVYIYIYIHIHTLFMLYGMQI